MSLIHRTILATAALVSSFMPLSSNAADIAPSQARLLRNLRAVIATYNAHASTTYTCTATPDDARRTRIAGMYAMAFVHCNGASKRPISSTGFLRRFGSGWIVVCDVDGVTPTIREVRSACPTIPQPVLEAFGIEPAHDVPYDASPLPNATPRTSGGYPFHHSTAKGIVPTWTE